MIIAPMNLKHSIQTFKKIFSPEPLNVVATELLRQAESIETQDERIEWFENLLRWLMKDSEVAGRYVRFKFLFQLLESHPEWRAPLKEQLRKLIQSASFLRLFLETGYSDQHGLLQEVAKRIVVRVIPRVRENDFSDIAKQVFVDEEELVWLAGIPETVLVEIAKIIGTENGSPLARLISDQANEALIVFLSHLTDLGLTVEIRDRIETRKPSESPFLLAQVAILNGHDDALSELRKCETAIAMVFEDMEKNGTSVGLVYRLEVMNAIIQRTKVLLKINDQAVGDGHPLSSGTLIALHTLLTDGVDAAITARSIIGHVHRQTHLLSRKIAERNGESGDHYIARSGSELRVLFDSALKGGVIVLIMTVLKMNLHLLNLPALPQALVTWLIYTAGFLLMQFTGSTLATKLPSFTASKLARLMSNVHELTDLDVFITEIKSVLKSQSLAFFGNIIAVVPLALVFNFFVIYIFGRHFISSEYAEETFATLHPIFSLAIPLGALTGVLLWLSSLAGGWFENWIVYRKIPRAILEHRRLRKTLGADFTAKIAHWLEHNASGISANVTLGFLFGFTPFFGFITGVPLDSKHVTISSAMMVLSSFSLEASSHPVRLITVASIGLVLIGIMNLTVSFALALVVAARASAISSRKFRVLLKLIGYRLLGIKKRV